MGGASKLTFLPCPRRGSHLQLEAVHLPISNNYAARPTDASAAVHNRAGTTQGPHLPEEPFEDGRVVRDAVVWPGRELQVLDLDGAARLILKFNAA